MQQQTQPAKTVRTVTPSQTPAEVAEWMTEKATDAKSVAMRRYPSNRREQLRDEAAQLRLIVETAAECLQQFDIERGQHLEEIARHTTKAEVVDEVHAQVERNYMQRLGDLALKVAGQIPTMPQGVTNA